MSNLTKNEYPREEMLADQILLNCLPTVTEEVQFLQTISLK